MDLDATRTSVQYGRADKRTIRSSVVNFLAALTVNAAIVLSVPRSTAIDPVPLILQHKRGLIDGRWHEGEYIGGSRPRVVLTDVDDVSARTNRARFISDN